MSDVAVPAHGREALEGTAARVATLMARLAQTVPAQDRAAPVQWARTATAEVTGLAALPGAMPLDDSPMAGVVADVASQVAFDVSSLTDAQRQAVTSTWGRGAHSWYLSVYLADWIPRVRHALDAAFGPSDWEQPELAGDPTELWSDFVALTEAIGAVRGIDPVVTELVRLRMARQHNCALCRSLRNRTALAAGGTEDLYTALDDWQHSDRFDARTRAALALADTLVWTPDRVDDVLPDLADHFTPSEVVELVIDMLRNAANKVAVASGTDAANVSEGQEIYDVTETGETVFGLGHVL